MTWVAWESLKKLKQIGSIRDYVKEFSLLILNIEDMSEVDKTELKRQGVQDLLTTMVVVDCLVDYKLSSSSTTT